MKMNRLETWMMNNPVRRLIQHHWAAPRLIELGGRVDGLHALEIGCGRGEGVRVILERFGAARVTAVDLDEEMIARARQRLPPDQLARVELRVGSVAALELPDASVDAVFGFGIIHHLPDWRGALDELARVLRPGGRFFSEESFTAFIDHPVWRRLLEHPRHDRFDPEAYRTALEARGFEIMGADIMAGDWTGWVVARLRPDRAARR